MNTCRLHLVANVPPPQLVEVLNLFCRGHLVRVCGKTTNQPYVYGDTLSGQNNLFDQTLTKIKVVGIQGKYRTSNYCLFPNRAYFDIPSEQSEYVIVNSGIIKVLKQIHHHQ